MYLNQNISPILFWLFKKNEFFHPSLYIYIYGNIDVFLLSSALGGGVHIYNEPHLEGIWDGDYEYILMYNLVSAIKTDKLKSIYKCFLHQRNNMELSFRGSYMISSSSLRP